MTIDKKQEDGQTIVSLNGNLDAVTSQNVETWFTQECDYSQKCTLALEHLEYISSAGLRVLLSLHKRFAAKGGHLAITHANEMVMDVFTITGFTDVLDIQ